MEHLHDMTRLVAFRSMLRSRVLYQRNRMTVALEDTAFEGLEFTPKRRTRLRTEKSVHEALGEFYRIVTENFGVEIETAGKGDARKPDATKPAGEAAKGGEDVRAPSPKPAAPAKGDAR